MDKHCEIKCNKLFNSVDDIHNVCIPKSALLAVDDVHEFGLKTLSRC